MALQIAVPTSGRTQIDRILHSETFRQADQLRHLLDYLAERSLSGESAGLKEYTVGVEALGKRADYDPRKDAAVRIQAGRLRTKLDEYYRTEGAADPTLVAMPKGGFRVEFSERLPLREEVPPPKNRRWMWAAVATASAILAMLAFRQSSKPGMDPALVWLWSPFLADRPPLMSVGPHLFWQSGEMVFRDWTVNRPEDAPRSKALASIGRLGSEPPRVAPFYVGYGETEGALAIARFLAGHGRALDFRRAPTLSWDDLKTRNVILLGSPKTIAHLRDIGRLEERLAFLMEENRIVNRSPSSGEPAGWMPRRENGELIETAAVVTRLRGGDGRGSILLIGSPDGEGTLAGCEAIASAAFARAVFARVGDAADFQVVVRASVKNQTPLKTTIVAHRRL